MNLTLIEDLVYKEYKDIFETFYQEYTDYNSHTNISAIRIKEEVFQKHFIDSLSLLLKSKELDLDRPNLKLLDIGTGGGFPAIPLAICKKNFDILAMDSVGKKIKFVEQVAEKLELENLKSIKARAEDLAHDTSFRESFDLVSSRAVAKLKTLIEISGAFVKVDGFMIAYKKLDISEELDEIKGISEIMGLKLFQSFQYMDDRQLIILRKTKSSPRNYPRKTSLL